MNIGGCQGGTNLGGGWIFLFLGSDDYFIGSSTLGSGLVFLVNSGAGWGLVAASFAFVVHSTVNSMFGTFVASLGGSASVCILSMLLLDVVSLKILCSCNNSCMDDSLRWCDISF